MATWSRPPQGQPTQRRRELAPGEQRLFIALPLSEDAAARLREALVPLRERFPAARWLSDETLHVTLLFLGPTRDEQVPTVREAVVVAAGLVPAFEARTAMGGGRVGHPSQGGLGVAWLNLDLGAAEAAHLATTLGERLGTGESWPAKGHAAHITVARRADRALVGALEEQGAVEPVSWHVDRMVLFASHLSSTAAHYEAVHVATLGESVTSSTGGR
jgi:RNA 2',3'-cyclic 3'-phosphodiesterase